MPAPAPSSRCTTPSRSIARPLSRVRTTEFHTGDVWKMLAVPRVRADADVITVAAAPSGLTLIRGLDPAWRPPEEAIRRFIEMPWERYEAQRLIPNERAAVAAWLGSQPDLRQ